MPDMRTDEVGDSNGRWLMLVVCRLIGVFAGVQQLMSAGEGRCFRISHDHDEKQCVGRDGCQYAK